MRRRFMTLILVLLFTGCASEFQVMQLKMQHEKSMRALDIQDKKYQSEIEKQYTLQRLELQEKESEREIKKQEINKDILIKRMELDENNPLFD